MNCNKVVFKGSNFGEFGEFCDLNRAWMSHSSNSSKYPIFSFQQRGGVVRLDNGALGPTLIWIIFPIYQNSNLQNTQIFYSCLDQNAPHFTSGWHL